MPFHFLSALVPLALLHGCAPDTAERSPDKAAGAGVRFVDIQPQSGPHFTNVSGSAQQQYILETMAGGAAFLDYDGDGYLDIFAINGTRLGAAPREGRNRLFHNEADGGDRRVFSEVDTDLGRDGWGMGCAVGDYDNDADPDIYMTYWGPNQLFRNDGGGRFTDVSAPSGTADPGWGSSAAFADLDGDGSLDLYVANYLEFDLEDPPGGGDQCHYKGLEVFCGPQWVPRQADRLFRNEGDGRFADMSAVTGVARRLYGALGVNFVDYDEDGDLDLYVANDGDPNLLYRNDGGWHLEEVGIPTGVAYTADGRAQAGMGVHSGDYDNDGDMDLFVTNFADDVNTLYEKRDDLFVDATYSAGLGGTVRPYLGWGTAFFDFDNDGWLDLFVANGHLYPQLARHPAGLRYAQRNLLYRNLRGHFAEVGTAAGPAWSDEKVSRATALGDYDNDGDTDLLVINLNDRPALLRNEGGNRHHWLGLELVGTASNRDAIGARVRVVAEDLVQVREVQRGYGFQAQHDPRLLFGLGPRRRAERVEIRWPSGRLQVLEAPPLDRYLLVREGSGELLARASASTTPLAPTAPPIPPAPDRAAPVQIGAPSWTARDYLQAGKKLYGEGRYGEARAACRRALELDPDHLPNYIELGVVLYSGLGRYREAAGVLERAVLRDSSQAEVHYWLGRIYLDLDQPKQAVTALKKAAKLAPKAWQSRHWLGLAHLRAGALAEAAKALEAAGELAPWEAGPHLQLSQIYRRLGRARAALGQHRLFERLQALASRVERYRLQVKAYPDDARAHSNLGMAYGEQGRLDEALDLFRKAIDLDPGYGRAHYGLATVFYRRDQLNLAIGAYEQACRLAPESPEAFNDLGRAYYRTGQYGKAVAMYRKALVLAPAGALIYDNLGTAHAAQGQFKEAIAAWEKVLSLAPDKDQTEDKIRRARQSIDNARADPAPASNRPPDSRP